MEVQVGLLSTHNLQLAYHRWTKGLLKYDVLMIIIYPIV